MYSFYKKIFFTFLLSWVFSASLSAATIGKPPLNPGLVGFWSFEDSVGSSKAVDKSGYGNTGTLTNGPLATSSKSGLGQALNFTGASSQYVNIPSNFGVGTANYTIVGWAYRANTGDHGAFVKIGGTSGGVAIGVGPNNTDGFETTGDNLLVLYEDQRWIPTSQNFGTGWHQFALVVDASGNPKIYFDGNYVYSDTSGAPSSPSAAQTQIGGYTSGISSNRHYTGSLDEVRFYNRALSSDEITRIYKIQKPRVAGGVSNTGLVAYWPLDEGSGTRAEDASFNSNNGTLVNGPAWVAGKNGKALSFDGADDKITTTYVQNAVTAYSVSAWIKVPVSLPGVSTIYQNRGADGSGQSLTFAVDGNNACNAGSCIVTNKLLFGLDSNAIFIGLTSNTSLNDNLWHHVVGTWAAANGVSVAPSQFKVYVDGVDDTSASTRTSGSATSPLTGNSSGAWIGRHELWSGAASGLIDDVRIYDRQLSASEVKSLYTGSKATVVNKSATGRLTNGLVGYWTFDGSDIYGTTAIDRSSSGNNGTMTNGPVSSLGKVGQAFSFDGVDDFTNVPTNFGLNGSSNNRQTFSTWFKTSSTAGTVIMGQTDNSVPPATPTSFVPTLSIKTDGKLRAEFWTGTVGGIISAASVADNNWHHAVFVGDDTIQTLYLDGELVGTRSGTINQSWWVKTIIGAGYDNTASNRTGANIDAWMYFNGKIDDVRVYNRALNADEAKALYVMGK